jgi:Mg2+-importing ATPase
MAVPTALLPASETAFWALPPEELLTQLHNIARGLSTAQAAAGYAMAGPTRLRDRAGASAVGLFLSQFKSPIPLILKAAPGSRLPCAKRPMRLSSALSSY